MNNKILHDYYLGQNCPADKRFDKDTEYIKLLTEITTRQEAFLSKLGTEDRAALDEIFTLMATLSTITSENTFFEGMKSGFQIALALITPDLDESG